MDAENQKYSTNTKFDKLSAPTPLSTEGVFVRKHYI